MPEERATLVFSDARVWRYIASTVSEFVDEFQFKITREGGLSLRSMDPSHTVMIEFTMPPTAFAVYDVKEDEISVGVVAEDLYKILARGKKGDVLEIKVYDDSVTFSLEGKYKRTFSLPIITTVIEKIPELKVEFKAKFKMLAKSFRDIVKDIELIGELVEVSMNEERILFKTIGEQGNVEVNIGREEGAILEYEVEGEHRAIYGIDAFVEIAKLAQVLDTVEFSFSTSMPCRLEYEIPGGGYIRFYVAPRG